MVPVRLLNETICLNCRELVIEDKLVTLCADDHITFAHAFKCENLNRCERISNDIEKSLKEKIELFDPSDH